MKHERGQVLPLFVIVITGILAMMALAIDISSAYSARQAYRTAADAAALAGAQDLQQPTTRTITAADYARARTDALASLVAQFGASGTGTCNPVADINDCALPGTGFNVSIKTPSPTCAACDPAKSVQVTVANHTFKVAFARFFGTDRWNVASTSVAGLQFGGQYAVITLRPPQVGRTGNKDNILINGTNSAVTAIGGDIGTNTGTTLNGHTATVQVDSGYYLRYYGALADAATPIGSNKQIAALIPDPKYPYPPQGTAPAGSADSAANCAPIITQLTANGYGTYSPANVTCYKPGFYNATLGVNNGKVAVLEPGIYYLNGGIDLKGTLIGGYAPASPGVALIIPYTQKVKLTGTPPFLALNRGTAFDGRAGGQEASAQLSTNETIPVTLSLIVTGNPVCQVVVPAPNCTSKTLDFSGFGGQGFVSIAGVVYAPSDNVEVAGNGDSRGYLGRIVAWTITYSGGSTLVQHYLGGTPQGIVRLDAACTAPGTPCTP